MEQATRRYGNQTLIGRRLESNAKSPIFEQFGSFLLGISSVRAYSKVPDYISRYVAYSESPCFHLLPRLMWALIVVIGCGIKSMTMDHPCGTCGSLIDGWEYASACLARYSQRLWHS